MRSRTERISAITKALVNPKGTKKVPWRAVDEYFSVIRLHGDMLAYRLENSRTTRQQQAYMQQHELPEDFFSDTESEEVQKAQEQILLKMAKSQPGFIEDLKARKQKDDLIITMDGYIINGNRRTSALKEIGENYFNCAVLPEDASAKDLYSLEQELQISTDFRMEYDWVNELNNIREGLINTKYGFTEKELTKNLRITPQDLKSKLKIIDLVDQFLDWRGESGNYSYSKLDKTRQAFEDVEKGMKKFADNPTHQLVLRNELFTLINNPPNEGRLYDQIRYLIKHFDSVQKKLGITVDEQKPHKPVPANQTSLDDIMGGTSEEEIYVPFDSSSDDNEDSSKIYDAIEDAKAEHKDKQEAEGIFSSAKSALRALTGLRVDENTVKKKETIATLKGVIKTSEDLISDLQ
ncbi:MAG: hypothetical protein ACQEWG_06240 [Bacteroidota bacterium]